MPPSLTSPQATHLYAFLIGGLVFSKLIPQLLTVLAVLYQNLLTKSQKKQQEESNSRGGLFGKRRRHSGVKFTKVGRPGLLVFQHVVGQLAGRSFQTQMQNALQGVIAQVDNPNIRSIELGRFQTNINPKTPPRLRSGRVYDGDGKCMVFDVNVAWKNCVLAELKITTKRLRLPIPVRVQNCHFRGTIRILLTPLIDQPPGFGACLISFPKLPDIDMDIDVAGGRITKVGWLKRELKTALKDLLTKEMLWPKRVVNPMLQENKNATRIPLDEIEPLKVSDPFLEMEKQIMDNRESKWKRVWQKSVAQQQKWRRQGKSFTPPPSAKHGPFRRVLEVIAPKWFPKEHSPDKTSPLNGEPSNAKESAQKEAGWNRFFENMTRPFELVGGSSQNPITAAANETKEEPALDLKETLQKMGEVQSFDEFKSFLDHNATVSSLDDRDTE